MNRSNGIITLLRTLIVKAIREGIITDDNRYEVEMALFTDPDTLTAFKDVYKSNANVYAIQLVNDEYKLVKVKEARVNVIKYQIYNNEITEYKGDLNPPQALQSYDFINSSIKGRVLLSEKMYNIIVGNTKIDDDALDYLVDRLYKMSRNKYRKQTIQYTKERFGEIIISKGLKDVIIEFGSIYKDTQCTISIHYVGNTPIPVLKKGKTVIYTTI